ncbi:MAG TPA: UDP-2,3-diacylglucosamine diphosphatase, partial [Steroidobacteraceae bacterium]
ATRPILHVRSAFISDLHLGSRECRADLVLDFLRHVHCEQLFLVGDVIDVWSLRRSFYWPQIHNDVLRTILGKTKHGTRVIYVPGNHDEQLREFCGSSFGNLEIHREYVHTTAHGRRLLILHGDEFDDAVQCNRALTALGSGLYDVALGANRLLNALRHRFGYPYWSLAGYLKNRVGNAIKYVRGFEQAAAQLARRRGLDGVVCGHIHRPAIVELGGMLYCNDGDWVDSCSALIEDRRGDLELWHWNDAGSALRTASVRGLPRAA